MAGVPPQSPPGQAPSGVHHKLRSAATWPCHKPTPGHGYNARKMYTALRQGQRKAVASDKRSVPEIVPVIAMSTIARHRSGYHDGATNSALTAGRRRERAAEDTLLPFLQAVGTPHTSPRKVSRSPVRSNSQQRLDAFLSDFTCRGFASAASTADESDRHWRRKA